MSRFIEEKMITLLRQGKISKWFSGIGQEAISVGATKAVKETQLSPQLLVGITIVISKICKGFL